MNKVIIKVVTNCLECEYHRSQPSYNDPASYNTHYCLLKWSAENENSVIQKGNNIGDFIKKPDSIKIPDWCPLEDHDPKFEDI